MPHHITRVSLERHYLIWWVWKIVAVSDDGTSPLVIAQGANLSKRKATHAVECWQRLYLRRLGRY